MGKDDDDEEFSVFVRAIRNGVDGLLHKPARVLRETIDSIRGDKTVPYYHRRFNRVPTIDQCYTDDALCRFEANQQFKRDRKVDHNILGILRRRWLHCVYNDIMNRHTSCREVKETYMTAREEWNKKYGQLPVYYDSVNALMKQKHRLIHERRMLEKAAAEAGMVDDLKDNSVA